MGSHGQYFGIFRCNHFLKSVYVIFRTFVCYNCCLAIDYQFSFMTPLCSWRVQHKTCCCLCAPTAPRITGWTRRSSSTCSRYASRPNLWFPTILPASGKLPFTVHTKWSKQLVLAVVVTVVVAAAAVVVVVVVAAAVVIVLVEAAVVVVVSYSCLCWHYSSVARTLGCHQTDCILHKCDFLLFHFRGGHNTSWGIALFSVDLRVISWSLKCTSRIDV